MESTNKDDHTAKVELLQQLSEFMMKSASEKNAQIVVHAIIGAVIITVVTGMKKDAPDILRYIAGMLKTAADNGPLHEWDVSNSIETEPLQ